jgi:hypothetical protein
MPETRDLDDQEYFDEVEHDNTCSYCGTPTAEDFCSTSCAKADLKENCRD